MFADDKCACLRRPIEARRRQSPRRAISDVIFAAIFIHRSRRRARDRVAARFSTKTERRRASSFVRARCRARTVGFDSRVSHCRADVVSGDFEVSFRRDPSKRRAGRHIMILYG
jgi:hypothetical protein